MYLEAVHLPVLEEAAGDDRARVEQPLAGGAEAEVRAKRPVGLEPGLDRACGDFHMGALAQDALGVREGIAEVEGRDRVEDRFQLVRAVLAGLSAEAVQALRALEELQRPQAVPALASPRSRLAAAVRARRIQLSLWICHFGELQLGWGFGAGAGTSRCVNA